MTNDEMTNDKMRFRSLFNFSFAHSLVVLITLTVYLSTFQTYINGSGHPYATDVGEIQNAFPRWGLIHRSGYPLYTATGSLFVALLRTIGVQPATSASLFSALWGVIAVGLLAALARELGAQGTMAALGALFFALSRSMWVYSSLAEVHTLTLAFSIATLVFAVRFGRSGQRRDLLLLALFLTQGVVHQRSVILLAPAVVVLIWPQFAALWRDLGIVIGTALLAPLTYLYLPLRVWTGATWIFGSPGTWEGFWEMVFDNRAERVFQLPTSLEEWRRRLGFTTQILADDAYWPLLALGLIGLVLWALKRENRREGLGMTLAWAPNFLLMLFIWKGKIGDAQLAASLPIMATAGVGLALFLEMLKQHSHAFSLALSVALALSLIAWGWKVHPFVLSITRDPSAEAIIATAEQVAPPPDDCPTTLVAPWGHTYWALAYAQECQNRLPGLNIVDHNADFSAMVKRGDRLLVLSRTLYVFPVSWWETLLGRLHLTSAAPDVIELSPDPFHSTADIPADVDFDLENGLKIRSAELEWMSPTQGRHGVPPLLLTVYWEAVHPIEEDYSVAVHLVAHDPPRGAEDVLTQADSLHPVDGWYPTSRWIAGKVVEDSYVLAVPPETSPVAVRIAMYRRDNSGAYVNTEWLSLPLE